LALPNTLNSNVASYKVEGIGYDFIPKVLDRSLVDHWIKTEDQESFIMSRRLIREEGLLAGGSSGTAMVAAMKVAKTMKKGERLVVLFPDSVRNYMSKFLNDNWMIDNGFIEPVPEQAEWWHSKTVSELNLPVPLTVQETMSCGECIQLLTAQGFDQLPVVGADGGVKGMVTTGNLSSLVQSGRVTREDQVSKALFSQFKKIEYGTSLLKLSNLFNNDHFALVVQTQRCYVNPQEVTEKSVVCGVVTRIDLLNYIMNNAPEEVKETKSPAPAKNKRRR
jgi:cystathionine beta-synthase